MQRDRGSTHPQVAATPTLAAVWTLDASRRACSTLVLPAIGMVGITVLILFTAPRGPSKSELGTSTQIIAAGSLVAIMGELCMLGGLLQHIPETALAWTVRGDAASWVQLGNILLHRFARS